MINLYAHAKRCKSNQFKTIQSNSYVYVYYDDVFLFCLILPYSAYIIAPVGRLQGTRKRPPRPGWLAQPPGRCASHHGPCQGAKPCHPLPIFRIVQANSGNPIFGVTSRLASLPGLRHTLFNGQVGAPQLAKRCKSGLSTSVSVCPWKPNGVFEQRDLKSANGTLEKHIQDGWYRISLLQPPYQN